MTRIKLGYNERMSEKQTVRLSARDNETQGKSLNRLQDQRHKMTIYIRTKKNTE